MRAATSAIQISKRLRGWFAVCLVGGHPVDDNLAGTKKEGLLTGSCLPPDDDRIRWSVIPLRNGTGAYWIAPVANKTLSLNVKSNKNENGNPVWLWPGSAANTDPASMWYIRLADGGSLSCPEVGKAPTNSHSRM
ncbi:hypothetical protein Q7P36_010274 [Cladosporium allicinum]